MGLADDVVAFALDEALATRLAIREEKALREAFGQARSPHGFDRRKDPPDGLRWATEADYDDPLPPEPPDEPPFPELAGELIEVG